MLVGLVLALIASAPCSAQSSARKPFSAEERLRLAQGELVTRPVREQRGSLRLVGGASWQVIKATPEQVFRALLDTPRYARLLPTVSEARLVSESPALRRVVFEHRKGFLRIAYRLALEIDAHEKTIAFRLNDPLESSVRAAWGFVSVHPYDPGSALLAWGVRADPGHSLIVSLVRGMIQEWILKVPWQVRRFMESPTGRALYGRPPSDLRALGQLDGGQPQERAP